MDGSGWAHPTFEREKGGNRVGSGGSGERTQGKDTVVYKGEGMWERMERMKEESYMGIKKGWRGSRSP